MSLLWRHLSGIESALQPCPPGEAADTSSSSANTFPQLYDALGRQFAVGLRLTF